MPRVFIILIVLLLIVVGLMAVLSSRAGEVPIRTVEVEVNTPANAR